MPKCCCEIKSSYWVKHHSHTHTAPITAAEVTPIHQSHSFSSHSILHIFIYFFGVHCCPSMLTSRQASQEVLWEAVRSWSLLFTFWLHSKWAFFFFISRLTLTLTNRHSRRIFRSLIDIIEWLVIGRLIVSHRHCKKTAAHQKQQHQHQQCRWCCLRWRRVNLRRINKLELFIFQFLHLVINFWRRRWPQHTSWRLCIKS